MQFTLIDKIYLVALIIVIILNINWYLTLFFIRLEERRKTRKWFFGDVEQGTGKKIPAEVLSDLSQQRWFLELDEEEKIKAIKNLTKENNMV